MQTETIIYIIIAAITALLLALFQYIYKSKLKSNLRYILAVLRTISIFAILLLLINPKFESITYFDEKPTLVIAVDNSESISYLKQDESANQIINNLRENSALQERFNVQTYSFGKSVKSLDSLNFSRFTNKTEKRVFTNTDLDGTLSITPEESFENVLSMDKLDKEVFESHYREQVKTTPIHHRVDKNDIERMLSSKLEEDGIDIGFEFAIFFNALQIFSKPTPKFSLRCPVTKIIFFLIFKLNCYNFKLKI